MCLKMYQRKVSKLITALLSSVVLQHYNVKGTGGVAMLFSFKILKIFTYPHPIRKQSFWFLFSSTAAEIFLANEAQLFSDI